MGGVSFPIGRRFCWFHISEEWCTTDPGSIDNVEILNSSGCKAHKSEQEQRGGDGFNGNDRTRHTRGLAISKHRSTKKGKLGVKGRGTELASKDRGKKKQNVGMMTVARAHSTEINVGTLEREQLSRVTLCTQI